MKDKPLRRQMLSLRQFPRQLKWAYRHETNRRKVEWGDFKLGTMIAPPSILVHKSDAKDLWEFDAFDNRWNLKKSEKIEEKRKPALLTMNRREKLQFAKRKGYAFLELIMDDLFSGYWVPTHNPFPGRDTVKIGKAIRQMSLLRKHEIDISSILYS